LYLFEKPLSKLGRNLVQKHILCVLTTKRSGRVVDVNTSA
jgi:hypothetical protein